MKRLEIDLEKLKELYDSGLSTRDIAKYFGVGQTTVRRKMDECGIVARSSKDSRNTEYHKDKMKPLWKSYEIDEIRQCEFCGKDFTTKPHTKQKYCDKVCHSKQLSIQFSNKIETKCGNCGETLYRIQSRLTLNEYSYCSRKCLGEWKSKNCTGENSPSWNRVSVKCGYCGKELLVPNNRLDHEKQYCDRDCMAKDYIGKFSGELSPTWRGGLTKKNYGSNWFRSRTNIRERDNFHCIRCGKSEIDNNEELSVHHIRLFRTCSNYTEANQPDNLVSLCRECHTFVHSNDNTKNEYLIG